MLLWVCFAVISAAVLAALLNPLLRPGPGDKTEVAADDRDIAIYKDQLAEVEAERERGQIGAIEADAAKAEIARRLLAAEDRAQTKHAAANPATPAAAASGRLRQIAGVVAVAVPLAAIGLYSLLGSPRIPAQPMAGRMAPVTDKSDISRLITTVEARLKQHPEDGQGWDVIGPVYLRLGRYNDAADAFSRAIRILGENPKRLAGLAEASVLASDGIVTEIARVTYEKLNKLEPGRPEPRFWLALAMEQDGQLKEALAAYRALLRDGDPTANWRPLVEERAATVEERLGGAPKAPLAKAAPSTKASEVARGPSAEDVAAANRLSEADRQKMIDGMVQSLADRLAKDGKDLAGWQRLIRAYTVMGRKDDAVAALGRARGNFTGEAQSLTELNELARQLGLES